MGIIHGFLAEPEHGEVREGVAAASKEKGGHVTTALKYVMVYKDLAECMKAMLKIDKAVLECEGAEQSGHSDAANIFRDVRCLGGDDNFVFGSVVDVLGDQQDNL